MSDKTSAILAELRRRKLVCGQEDMNADSALGSIKGAGLAHFRRITTDC